MRFDNVRAIGDRLVNLGSQRGWDFSHIKYGISPLFIFWSCSSGIRRFSKHFGLPPAPTLAGGTRVQFTDKIR